MEPSRRILVIEDDPMNNRLLVTILTRLGYAADSAFDGASGLTKVASSPPDLILLDLDLPGMHGYDVARQLKQSDKTKIIPIVIVSSFAEVEYRIRALEAGADDFLTKPIDQIELRARVQSLLKVKDYNDYMVSHQKALEREVDKRTIQLRKAFEDLKDASDKLKLASLDTTIRLSQAAEYKDEETGSHIKRMGYYTEAIAKAMALPQKEIEAILYAAPMHDIGKIGIPDRILLKKGSLDQQEWEIMKRHTIIGANILSGSDSFILQMAEQIALTHHEKWGGSGYPRGLKGPEIHVWGQISAIADAFDAMTTRRPYKTAWPVEDALNLLAKDRGTHFCPDVLDAFFSIEEEILSIRQKYDDPDSNRDMGVVWMQGQLF